MVGGVGIPVPEVPPDGSVSIDTVANIDASLLSYLSDSAKSKILSTSNIGGSTTKVINKALEKIDVIADATTFLIDETILNNLTSGSSSSSIVLSNTGSSVRVKIIIYLGEITPTVGAKIQVTDGTTTYEIGLSTATSVKKITFDNIESSFVSSFQITNESGVSFASWGNSVLVVGL